MGDREELFNAIRDEWVRAGLLSIEWYHNDALYRAHIDSLIYSAAAAVELINNRKLEQLRADFRSDDLRRQRMG